MTNQQANMATAEACGWKWYRLPQLPSDKRAYRCLFIGQILCGQEGPPKGYTPADMSESICNWEYMRREGFVHDYGSDLNAMHEAEKILLDVQLACYSNRLENMAMAQGKPAWHAQFSTAKQRRESFLRTIGKWTD